MKDNEKKQVPLRLSPKLYAAVAAWAEDDFRSINGQIEYLLSECVRQRKKNGKYVGEEIDKPLDIEIEWKRKHSPPQMKIKSVYDGWNPASQSEKIPSTVNVSQYLQRKSPPP